MGYMGLSVVVGLTTMGGLVVMAYLQSSWLTGFASRVLQDQVSRQLAVKTAGGPRTSAGLLVVNQGPRDPGVVANRLVASQVL